MRLTVPQCSSSAGKRASAWALQARQNRLTSSGPADIPSVTCCKYCYLLCYPPKSFAMFFRGFSPRTPSYNCAQNYYNNAEDCL